MIARRVLAAALAVLAGAASLDAASVFDPLLRFRRITTEHFVIYYHQGGERLAARLAVIVEDTRDALARTFAVPSSRTHVVLADQTELANGWATPVPYNTIVLYAVSPAGSDLTGHADDWLRVLFAHEFTHIAHLDRSGHWARLVRGVFGRVPLAFPNFFLPVWEIEGVATYQESRLTGSGRLRGSSFGRIAGEAARTGALEPMDRVNGGVTDWPGGHGPYAYGVGFHAYLAERFGESDLDALADRSARAIPYAGSFAFRDAFGSPLHELWAEYLASLGSTGDVDVDHHPSPVRLTTQGFLTSGPRFLPPGCDGCPLEIAYTTQTPHEFPSIRSITPGGGTPAFLASRYLGASLGATRDVLVFDQQELRRNAGLYSDLYTVERATGRVTALTREARLRDPDLTPDGRSVVAVRQAGGDRTLVVLRLARHEGRLIVESVHTLVAAADTQFNAPRWSPDGRWIAVERHRLGALPEIVLVDSATSALRVLATSPRHAFVTPAWRPDGLAVLAAADPDGIFQVFEFPVDGGPVRQVTSVHGGATWPDVSPDGRTLVFVGYTTDGFDVFTSPYPSGAPFRSDLTAATAVAEPTALPVSEFHGAVPESATYRPWTTLRPTYWAPAVSLEGDQFRIGAFTGGVDVLQYHGFRAQATWLVDTVGRNPAPRPAGPDFEIGYAYARWRPTLYASASQTTTLFNGPVDASGFPVRGAVQERALEGGVVLPARSVRRSSQWVVSVRRESVARALLDRRTVSTQHALRTGWMTRSALTHGYSISPERGTEFGTTVDWRPDVRGAAVTTVTVDGRAYLPGLGRHHVTAIRAAAGASFAARGARRTFLLGGAGAARTAVSFDRGALGLLRGFPEHDIETSRLAVFNADYRWPIARPQRGIRTFPLLLHSVHAALFGDAAYAWDVGARADDVRAAAGAELSFDIVAGYRFPFTAAMGGAWTIDPAAAHRGASFFARVGRSF